MWSTVIFVMTGMIIATSIWVFSELDVRSGALVHSARTQSLLVPIITQNSSSQSIFQKGRATTAKRTCLWNAPSKITTQFVQEPLFEQYKPTPLEGCQLLRSEIASLAAQKCSEDSRTQMFEALQALRASL